MGLQVSIGLARDLPADVQAMVLLLPEPVEIAGQTYERLSVELFGFDPSMAPDGKGVLKVMLETSYAYWKELRRRRERYTGVGRTFEGSLGIPMASFLSGRGIVRTLPGLEDFYMVGQWAGFPGIPWVAAMGRSLVQHLCRQDGRRFVTAVGPDGGSCAR